MWIRAPLLEPAVCRVSRLSLDSSICWLSPAWTHASRAIGPLKVVQAGSATARQVLNCHHSTSAVTGPTTALRRLRSSLIWVEAPLPSGRAARERAARWRQDIRAAASYRRLSNSPLSYLSGRAALPVFHNISPLDLLSLRGRDRSVRLEHVKQMRCVESRVHAHSSEVKSLSGFSISLQYSGDE